MSNFREKLLLVLTQKIKWSLYYSSPPSCIIKLQKFPCQHNPRVLVPSVAGTWYIIKMAADEQEEKVTFKSLVRRLQLKFRLFVPL